MFINDVIILASIYGFNFRPPIYWEYTIYSQYIVGLKWNPLKMMMPFLGTAPRQCGSLCGDATFIPDVFFFLQKLN